MTEIAGKAAVVTGGGSGIGMGLAKELARQGASVAVADILPDNARKVADEINDAGGTAVAIHCDVCDRSSIEQMKAEANAALGTIQLVFANAGATSFMPVTELTESELDWMTEVNLKGVVWTALTFLPDMIEAGGGHIMATASMAGLIPTLVPVHTAYAAAKMGVIGFMRSMQLEVEEHDVFCTIYCPGGVLNGMRDNNAKYRPERFGGPSDEQMQIPKASFKDNRLRFSRPRTSPRSCCGPSGTTGRSSSTTRSSGRASASMYSDVVEACFDDIEQWEQENGLSTVQLPMADPRPPCVTATADAVKEGSRHARSDRHRPARQGRPRRRPRRGARGRERRHRGQPHHRGDRRPARGIRRRPGDRPARPDARAGPHGHGGRPRPRRAAAPACPTRCGWTR